MKVRYLEYVWRAVHVVVKVEGMCEVGCLGMKVEYMNMFMKEGCLEHEYVRWAVQVSCRDI